jgi:hypothetical protein
MLTASFFVLFLKRLSNPFLIWYYYLFANFRLNEDGMNFASTFEVIYGLSLVKYLTSS